MRERTKRREEGVRIVSCTHDSSLVRSSETISTAFVESTINQVVSRRFVKKQQMQWTQRGAHLLLQTRTKDLNEELDEVFRRWFPRFRPQPSTSEQGRKAPDP